LCGNSLLLRVAVEDRRSILQGYAWPRNVRELQNIIERAVILSDGDSCSVDETWLKLSTSRGIADPAFALNDILHKQEKEMIEAALAESHGCISGRTGAASKLGIPTRTLDSKIGSEQECEGVG
jgi:formate hydrogenlyase transcriptional activator